MLPLHQRDMVAMDSFEMSTYRLSSDCSSSELHGYKQQDTFFSVLPIALIFPNGKCWTRTNNLCFSRANLFAVSILKLFQIQPQNKHDNDNRNNCHHVLLKLARRERFKLSTLGSVALRSIQLS